ncbi:MAG: GAF domain-containing protein, partial [Gloeomargaritaceae cyanobacterium C42_A2020_066]|nr:GAF domain-containing protein [Gloeomargaritaceae cyanobacterium C42_A2020_066]
HLKVDRWLLLLQNPDTHHYEITYQSHRKRPLAGPLSALHPLDQELLEQNTGAIGIANWGSDLKFMTWRHTLLNQGVKSLVVANSAPGQSPAGLLVIAQGEPRHWSPEECQLVQAIAQQLGVVVRQWQLEQQNQQQQDMYRAVCQGLELLPDLELGDASQLPLLKHMAQLLQVPQVALVTWTASDRVGKVLAADPTQERFSVATDQTVDTEQDPLIQAALATSGPWLQNAVELEPSTRQWLTGLGIGQVLALALRPQSGQPPTGVLLALDGPHQVWPDRLLQFIQLLGQQLSRTHRTHNLLQIFRNRAQEMGCRLWLWQWRWQDLHRELERLAQKDPHDPEVGHRLTNLLKAVTLWPDQDTKPLLGDALQAIALPGLLRRAVDRVGDMISKRQLWLKIHQTATGHTLGHPFHLELVLGQLLQFACSRSPVGGRVDVWCQPVDEQWLEIVITDYGAVLSTLLEALQAAGRPDPLAPSPLDQSPGRELSLCRFLMAESGAELTFERLPDGRFSSRLYLPAGRT